MTEPKKEEKVLRRKKNIRPQGGGAAIIIPMEFIRELGWTPRTEVTLTVLTKPFPGLVLEQVEKVEKK